MSRLDLETEKLILGLKDKFFNCEINDIEYRNGLKKILGHCNVKILPSKTAQVFFVSTDIYLVIDDWDGIKYKKGKKI